MRGIPFIEADLNSDADGIKNEFGDFLSRILNVMAEVREKEELNIMNQRQWLWLVDLILPKLETIKKLTLVDCCFPRSSHSQRTCTCFNPSILNYCTVLLQSQFFLYFVHAFLISPALYIHNQTQYSILGPYLNWDQEKLHFKTCRRCQFDSTVR